jgi:hypothetical protein
VLCVDEKSQIQALDRTQPGLPLKRGCGTTMTHDHKRNGAATLFAALNTSNGEVMGFAWNDTVARNSRGSCASSIRRSPKTGSYI